MLFPGLSFGNESDLGFILRGRSLDLKSKDDSKWYLQNNLAEHKCSIVKLDRLEIKSVDF